MLVPSTKPWPVFDKIHLAFRWESFSIQKIKELLFSKFRSEENRFSRIKEWVPTHQTYTFGDQRPKFESTVEIMEEHSRVLIEDLMRLGTAEGYQSCLSVKDRNRAAHSNAQIRKQTELMRNLDDIKDIEKAREDCFESDRWDGERRVRDVFQEEERMLNRFLQWVF